MSASAATTPPSPPPDPEAKRRAFAAQWLELAKAHARKELSGEPQFSRLVSIAFRYAEIDPAKAVAMAEELEKSGAPLSSQRTASLSSLYAKLKREDKRQALAPSPPAEPAPGQPMDGSTRKDVARARVKAGDIEGARKVLLDAPELSDPNQHEVMRSMALEFLAELLASERLEKPLLGLLPELDEDEQAEALLRLACATAASDPAVFERTRGVLEGPKRLQWQRWRSGFELAGCLAEAGKTEEAMERARKVADEVMRAGAASDGLVSSYPSHVLDPAPAVPLARAVRDRVLKEEPRPCGKCNAIAQSLRHVDRQSAKDLLEAHKGSTYDKLSGDWKRQVMASHREMALHTRAAIAEYGSVLDEWPTLDSANRVRVIDIAYEAALRWKDLEPDPTVVRRLDDLIASVSK